MAQDERGFEHGVNPMEALLEDEQYGMSMPSRGEIRHGVLARVTPNEILVDIGAKSEGIITGKELERIESEVRDSLEVGQEVTVYVVSPEDRNGNVVLSLSRAQEEKDWSDAESLLGSQDVYEGVIAGFNKGGLIVKVGNVRGFIPASQLSMSRRRRSEGDSPEQKWAKMVGEAVQVKVIEVDRSRNRLILSERAAAKESREAQKDKLLASLKEGDKRKGHVISLADFGAFVDIGGADGLVHLSEISWKRVAHPKEVLRVGQEVEVMVLNVDRERKRIGLSIKRLAGDPWTEIAQSYQVGQLVQGTVTKLAKFGAFARLAGEDDVEGLIHVSELSDARIEHPKEAVQEGQTLTLRIVKIDPEKKRIGLSLKRVASASYADTDWEPPMDIDEAVPDEESEAPSGKS